MLSEKELEKEQKETLGFSRYRQPVQNMARLRLATITTQDIDDTVKPFLYRWGRMQRRLGGPKWQSMIVPSLIKEIVSNAASLEDLRKYDLATIDLSRFESVIRNLYEPFKEALAGSGVAAGKLLHLICPSCLPAWDTAIADAARRESWVRMKIVERIEPWSWSDYRIFMEQIQIWLIRYENVLSDLAKECRGTPLGVLDAYLWWVTQRPFLALS
jgi:hypothetical protein